MVRARVPITKVQGSRRDARSMLMSLLAGMVAIGGRPYPGDVSTGPAVLGYVSTTNFRLLILLYARDYAMRDQTVEPRTRPGQQALLSGDSILVNPSLKSTDQLHTPITHLRSSVGHTRRAALCRTLIADTRGPIVMRARAASQS